MVATNVGGTRTPVGRHKERLRGASSSSLPRSSIRRTSSAIGNAAGTTSSTTPSAISGSSVIIAITGGRGDARGEVGIAAIDLRHPKMILCQISDRQTYSDTLMKIHVLQPVEILMPDSISDKRGREGKLLHSIQEKFPGVNITSVSRMHFNDGIGLDRIRMLCAEEYSTVELFVKQKFYALAAAAALLKYVEFVQNVLFAAKSMKVEFQGSQDTTIIDVESAQSLELVAVQNSASNSSLLGVLDRCSTPGGRRFLRASILQPPCDKDLIEERQACVSEMVNNEALLSTVQSTIKRLCGVDRLLTLCMLSSQNDSIKNAEKNLNYVLLLKNILEIIPFLHGAIENAEADFFGKVRRNLRDPRYKLMIEKILEVIQSEARSVMGFTSSNMQRCFALKAGVNEMLDIARQTYCELIDDMKCKVEELATRFKLPLTLGCSAELGYHIQMDVLKQKHIRSTDLPSIFVEVQKRRNCYYMTTDEILVLSQQCKDACEELHLMSNVMLDELLFGIRGHIGCLYQLSTDVAELDLIASIARISSIQDYVKPTFGPRLQLKYSKHPTMDIAGYMPVANHVNASISHNFYLLMGPNMSGKSVYLRQIVMLQIMAQIGCYVPAEKAQFRLADRIFCRICFGDSIDCNASSFVLEMKETRNILQMITPKSLVIMDELCRGTTEQEGTSIAWAVCEELLRTSAFVFFTTHFLYLTKLVDLYPNVTNLHFEALSKLDEGFEKSRLIYTHKLKSGVPSVEKYGLSIARASGMPDSLVDAAYQTAAVLAEEFKPVKHSRDDTDSYTRRCYDFFSKADKKIEDNKFTKKGILHLIQKFQNNMDMSEDTSSHEQQSIQNGGSMDICEINERSASSSSSYWNVEPAEKIRRKRVIDGTVTDVEDIPRYPLEPKVLIKKPLQDSNQTTPSLHEKQTSRLDTRTTQKSVMTRVLSDTSSHSAIKNQIYPLKPKVSVDMPFPCNSHIPASSSQRSKTVGTSRSKCNFGSLNVKADQKFRKPRIISGTRAYSDTQIQRNPLEPKVLVDTTVPVGSSRTSTFSRKRLTTVGTPRSGCNLKTLQPPQKETVVKFVSSDQKRRESVLNRHAIVISDSDYLKGNSVSRGNDSTEQEISISYADRVVPQMSVTELESSTQGSRAEDEISGIWYSPATTSMGSKDSPCFLKKRWDVVASPASSNDTECAKISARKKEAAIFRIIEGDKFQESEFYSSPLTEDDCSSLEIIECNVNKISTAPPFTPVKIWNERNNDEEINECQIANRPSRVVRNRVPNKYIPIFIGNSKNEGSIDSTINNVN